jgi:hypothetical protein
MSQSSADATTEWQWRSRPLMVGVLAVLTVFFFSGTLYQLVELNRRIENSPTLDAAALLQQTVCPPALSSAECMEYRRLNLAVSLEAHIIAKRHHQAGVTAMASIWSRYLGFITGMVLALVGAAFILGQLRDRGTQIEASNAAGKAAMSSASPGLVMVALGVVLMITTIITLHRLHTADAPIYFTGDPATLPRASTCDPVLEDCTEKAKP